VSAAQQCDTRDVRRRTRVILALETQMLRFHSIHIKPPRWLGLAAMCLALFPLSVRAESDWVFGALFLASELIWFFFVGAIAVGIITLCVARHMRRRVFWASLLLWSPFCMILVWGPSIASVAHAWAIGEAWGSYSGDFPGYLNLLIRYIAVNHLIPHPKLQVLAISIAAIAGTILAFRFRSLFVAAGTAAVLAGIVILAPNVREAFRADRCLDLGSSYNYVVGRCADGPFPYLPRHQRHPILSFTGVAFGVAALGLLVAGLRVSNKRVQAPHSKQPCEHRGRR
jgi:hypothetical protein